MKFILTIVSLAFTMNLFASYQYAQDGLCFLNADKELANFGPLGRLGVKEGICQGMSGLVSAFHEKAEFIPSSRKISDTEAFFALKDIMRLHSGGCKKGKVKIHGYANLQEFCQSHKSLLMESAIQYNLDIAIREIGWNIGDFLYYKDRILTNQRDLAKINKTVSKIKKYLQAGKWPLFLYYKHAVTIHSMKEEYLAGKLSKVKLQAYDSNFKMSVEIVVEYANGKVKSGQRMIWDITPNRLTTICW